MVVDTHCHLVAEEFKEDRSEVVEAAKKEGVKGLIVPSTGIEESKKVAGWVKKIDGVYGLAGVHPERVIRGKKDQLDKLNNLLKKEQIIGVGEIGLDFYWDKEKKSRQEQMRVFEEQLKIAVKNNQPVVIHMREAEEEVREVMGGLSQLPRGQFHCWLGKESFLEFVLERDFYVSFAGNVTYPGSERLKRLVGKVPIERLLLETDSPYLSPEKKRGERNEPRNVIINATFLAGLLGISEKKFFDKTRQNTKDLFNI